MTKQKGTIKFFNADKGFGFITPETAGGKDLFVHINNYEGNASDLREGTKVFFEEGQGRKGPEAKEVTLA